MTQQVTPFRVTHDTDVGASYIYVAGAIPPGGVHRTVLMEDISLDFDKEGRLLGIEVLSASFMHPATLAVAEKISGERS